MIIPVSPTAGLRNHPSNWVKEPEKANTHCLYCHQPVPNHGAECHVPLRTVVLEMTIRYVASVPVVWDTHMIEFHRNESSWCSSNDIKQIFEESTKDAGICTTCHRTEIKFLREATEKDLENLNYIPQRED